MKLKLDGRSKAARDLKKEQLDLREAILSVPHEPNSFAKYAERSAQLMQKKSQEALQGIPNYDQPHEPKSVLQEAHELIHGVREDQYGHPKKNLQAIADMWEMYLHHKYSIENFVITPEDICQMMVLLKMCRSMSGEKRDDPVDMAGYIGLIGRVRYGE